MESVCIHELAPAYCSICKGVPMGRIRRRSPVA